MSRRSYGQQTEIPIPAHSGYVKYHLDDLNKQGWRKGDKARVLHTNKSSFWRLGYPTYMPIRQNEIYDVMGIDLHEEKAFGKRHLLILLFDDTAEISAYEERRLERIPG